MAAGTWRAVWSGAAPVMVTFIVIWQTVMLLPVPDVDVYRGPSFAPTMSLSASNSNMPLGDDALGRGWLAGRSHWAQREDMCRRERGMRL
jgi:hypothetical protein